MSAPRRRERGRLYSGLLTLMVVAVVAVAASALYLTAGGTLYGWSGAVFGIDERPDSLERVLRTAREAAWTGRFDDAVTGFDSAVAYAPNDPAVAIERARVLGWAGRYGEAADAVAAVRDTSALELDLERARWLWWAGRPGEADSLLSAVLARHPGTREARELQDLVRPAVEPAVATAERWVRERPDDAFSHLWLARALVHDGRGPAALRHYRAALADTTGTEPEVMLETAGVALGADSLRFATEVLSRYLYQVDPADRASRLRLARAFAWSGRYAEAEEQYRRVLAEAPDPALRRELARVLVEGQRYDAAVQVLRPLTGGDAATADLLELARVLALADRYADAADVLARVLERRPGDRDLALRHARYLWWGERLPEADAALSALLAGGPEDDQALELRAEIRQGIDPSADLAREWIRLDDTRENRVRLARILVNADRHAEALEHYHVALDRPAIGPAVRDSITEPQLLLEFADVAQEADSLRLATRLLQDHRRTSEADVDPALVLRLARLYAWSERPDSAIVAYAEYLDLRPADTEARFERARQLAWQDSTRWAEAADELVAVANRDALHAPALALLGDLARWRSEPAEALTWYRAAAAIDPDLEGLEQGIQRAIAMREAQRPAQDATRVQWALELDAHSDSQGFDWLASGARYDWTVGGSTVSLRVGQGWSAGRPLPGAGLDDLGALGFTVDARARVPLADRWHGVLGAGLASYDGTDPLLTLAAALEYRTDATRAVFDYERGPAIREAATMAALQAGTTLDRLRVMARHTAGPWTGTAEAQLQRFGAGIGDVSRAAGMARADRAVGHGLSVGAMVRAIAAGGDAPVLPGWGPVVWAPGHYVAPALTLGWGRPVGDGWWVGLRAAPGYAWIDERAGGVIRYEDGSTPILEAGATLGWRGDAWAVDLSGDWGGNLSPAGYDAGTLKIEISRTGGGR